MQEIKSARGGGAESSTGLARQVGQKPCRGSRIVTGERRGGEFCDPIFVAARVIDVAASRNCGDLADFEGELSARLLGCLIYSSLRLGYKLFGFHFSGSSLDAFLSEGSITVLDD